VPHPAPRPAPPPGARNLVIVILDSLRYDTWLAAKPRSLAQIGMLERRYSYATWTAPSHYNLLMGLLPNSSPPHVYASEYYKQDFLRYRDRLGLESMEYRSLLPSLFLPTLLRSLGYANHARVSMPVLNPFTILNHDFDSYKLMPSHNDMTAIVDELSFSPEHPSFWLLNVGETHYPYSFPGGPDGAGLPHISGVHGVVKGLDALRADSEEAADFFTPAALRELHERQIGALAYLDGVFERLLNRLPADTWLIVTSDHGELFGEDGYFGHGPIMHEKVLEVPFLEGLVR
jgi:arylsulfatase A-like enzyme